MNKEQKATLRAFLNSQPIIAGSQPNPYIPGKDWKVGDCYTAEEKAMFRKWWSDFAAKRPDIISRLPIRN